MPYSDRPFYLLREFTAIAASPVVTLSVVSNSTQVASTSLTLQNLVFAGAGNVSVGVNGGTVLISATGGGGGGGGGAALSAGTQSVSSGTVVFSNSNGITFGMSGSSRITASYTVPGATIFSNSNNVTFGLNGSTVTASVTVVQSTQPVAISGSNGSFAFSTVTWGNLNGMSFYTSNGSMVGSYTVPTQTVQPGIQSIQVSNTTYTTGNVIFSNANGLSFGSSAGGAITASYTVPTVTNSSMTVSDSLTSGTVARLAFTNLNGVTLSLSSGAGGSHTIVGSVVTSYLTSQSNQNVTAGNGGFAFQTLSFSNANNFSFGTSAGSAITASFSQSAQPGIQSIQVSNTTYTTGNVIFSNANGASFGSSAGGAITLSYTVPTQTNQTVGMYALGNTTQNSSTTFDARTLGSFNAIGSLTIGYSNGSIQFSAPNALTSQSNQNLSLFGLGNTTQNSSTVLGAAALSLNGLGIVTVGYSNGSIQISATTPSQTVQTIGLYALGNTTQNSSTTFDARTMGSFNAIGSLTIGYSNGSIQFSAPNALTSQSNQAWSGSNASSAFQTLSFSNANGVSWSNNAGQVVITHDLQYTSNTSNITSNALNTSASRVINILVATNNTGGGTSSMSSNVSFGNLNGLTFYHSNGSIVGSYTDAGAGGGISAIIVSAGGNNTAISNLSLADASGVSWGINGSTITASVDQNISFYGLGNTTQNSSTVLSKNVISFNGLGGMTIGYSNGSIQLSGPVDNSIYQYEPNPLISGSAVSSHTINSGNMVPFVPVNEIVVSRLNWAKSWNIATTSSSNSSYSGRISYSFSAQLWGRSDLGANSSVLTTIASTTVGLTYSSSLTSNSFSAGHTYWTNINSTSWNTSSYSTSSAGMNISSLYTGLKYIYFPFQTTITIGEYWIGFQHSQSATTAGVNQSLLMSNLYVTHQLTSMGDLANRTAGSVSAISNQGLGVFSNTTATTLIISNINQSLPHRLYFNLSNYPTI